MIQTEICHSLSNQFHTIVGCKEIDLSIGTEGAIGKRATNSYLGLPFFIHFDKFFYNYKYAFSKQRI